MQSRQHPQPAHRRASSASLKNQKGQSQQNLSSSIKQQQNIQVPNVDLKDYTEINQSGYFINYKQLLGKGRFGEVYLGYSKPDQIKMAVKKIPQSTQNGTNVAFETKKQIDMLQQICSDRSNHKNVLKYYHYEDYEGFFYVFTEFCEKGSLKQYVAKKGQQISQKQYFRILKSIVQGMIFINKKFIIHRDIKPANILVNEKDEVKIGDFGISREIPLGDEAPTKNMCTPHYGAPQILRQNQFYTQNIDVWSCGVMMYELIQKKSIYEKYRPKTVNQLVKALKLFEQSEDFVQFSNPNISDKFQKIIKKMLTIQHSKRPAFEQIQKYIEYEQLVKFYHLYESPNPDLTGSHNTGSRLLGYNEQQKEKYIKILKKYLKYKRQKINILLALHKKFMNKPFQVLWNVEKFILKYLTLNMFIIKAQEYSNWLHVSLNDNIINLENEIWIKIIQFRYNYRMIAQMIREEKKKIDSDIRKYYKSVLIQAEKIQIDYLNREKESQRIRSYIDIRLIEELFAYTRKNSFARFESYHNLYKSLIQLRQYYLTYEHVQALPTFQDKQIYFYMLLIYHFDKFFSQQKYVRELFVEDEINSTDKDNRQTQKAKREDRSFVKSFGNSLTGYMAEGVSQFRERMDDEKEMMKWIRRHNLPRQQVFGKSEEREPSHIASDHRISMADSKIKSMNMNQAINPSQKDKANMSKSIHERSLKSSKQMEPREPQVHVLPSEERKFIHQQ